MEVGIEMSVQPMREYSVISWTTYFHDDDEDRDGGLNGEDDRPGKGTEGKPTEDIYEEGAGPDQLELSPNSEDVAEKEEMSERRREQECV